MREFRGGRNGIVVLMIALGAPFFFGLAGLAVDSVLAYAVKGRLVTAVDACALAAARSIGKGQTEMNRIVDLMFDSNFPPSLLLSTDRGHSAPVITSVPAEGRREVKLTGFAVVPTIFMRLFGFESLRLEASAQAARRDVNVLLVLDRSASMSLANAWAPLQDAASFFVNQFDTSADRLGLVTFGTTSRVDYPISYSPGVDFKTPINNLIYSQQSLPGNYTNTSQALYQAYAELVALNDAQALNVIVFFTDGQPTAFANYFRVKTTGSDPKAGASPIYGVVTTNPVNFTKLYGISEAYATRVPADEGGNGDQVKHPALNNGYSMTANNTNNTNTETLLGPTAANGLYHYRPNGPNSLPEFRLDVGPHTVNMSGSTLVNGSDSAQGKEVIDMAMNASLEITRVARDGGTLNEGIRIYGIGLGGFGAPADHDFMKALANTSDSNPHYDDQPEGIYYYAPGPSQLRQAFQTVASEIFRLIQ